VPRPEETIEFRFVDEVMKLGYKARKLEIRGEKGAPDRFVLLPKGIIFFVEFKAPGKLGDTTPHQKRFHDELRRLNHIVMVTTSWEKPLYQIKLLLECSR